MRADRLISLLLLLQANHRMTASALAEQLAVSERTVYRDIDALSLAGIPVYTQSGPQGGIFLDEHYRVSLTGLSREQVLSLFISTEAGPLADIGLDEAVQQSLAKLFARLPSSHQSDVTHLRARFHIDPSGWFPDANAPALLESLQAAVWQDRQVQMDYQTVEHGPQSITVAAYGLVSKADRWYMVGRKPDGDYRTYRLARIQQLTVQAESFQRDPAFDLAAYWASARQNFQANMTARDPALATRLALHPDMFWYVGSFLEGRYRIEHISEDDGWYSLRVTFGGVHEARMHLLALADYARVLEPASLAADVLAQARRIVAHYDSRS